MSDGDSLAGEDRCSTYDAVVVGGGPAGMAAARTIAEAGLTAAILDESDELGGQYFKRRRGAVLRAHGDFRPEGTAQIQALRAADVHRKTSCLVWGLGDTPRSLMTSSANGELSEVRGSALIIATGAYERSLPFPGWQLPGVVTPGLALHLATCDRVRVGNRVLVAGTGPFLLPVACALLDVGCEVVGVAEANSPYRLNGTSVRSARYPARLLELARYVSKLQRHRVPIWQQSHVVSAEGSQRLEGIHLSRRGATSWIPVDALAIGYGFQPATELARLVGCAEHLSHDGTRVPLVDRHGRTSVKGVYVAGEAAGVAGRQAAQLRGQLAGAAVLQDRGMKTPPVDRELRHLARLENFAAMNSVLFPVPRRLLHDLPPSTLLCRCEGVTVGEAKRCAASGDPNAVKGSTRAGMGPCQGRECGYALGVLTNRSGEAAALTSRPPIRPIPIGAFAAGAPEERQ